MDLGIEMVFVFFFSETAEAGALGTGAVGLGGGSFGMDGGVFSEGFSTFFQRSPPPELA